MLAILGLIPGLMGLIEAIVGKVSDNRTKVVMAQLGVDRDKALAIIQAQTTMDTNRVSWLSVVGSNWVLTWLIVAFATPLVWYFGKCVIYDTILGLGSTAPIHGQVADWASAIIYSLFGSAAAVGSAAMLARR